MSHTPAVHSPASPASTLPSKDRSGVLVSGALFGEGEAEAWVKKLYEMNNEQLAEVLGAVFCQLTKNRP